jgi:hypothetical protein
MLFYQFLVCRKSAQNTAPRHPTEARVMLRVDSDVDRSTEAAVRYLDDRGWRITSVRRAQHGDTPEEFSANTTLLHLYEEAARRGIACTIDALDAPAANAEVHLVEQSH